MRVTNYKIRGLRRNTSRPLKGLSNMLREVSIEMMPLSISFMNPFSSNIEPDFTEENATRFDRIPTAEINECALKEALEYFLETENYERAAEVRKRMSI